MTLFDANPIPPCIDLHLHTQYSDGDGTIPEIAEKALKKGFTAIAFTDHTNIEGDFLNTRYGKQNFATYLADIQKARVNFPGITIWCGIEISENFGVIPYSVESIFRACDLILVDGYDVKNPFLSAQRIRDSCELSRMFGKNIGVAHPKFNEMTPTDWSIITRSQIFLELNNPKLNKAQIAAIKRAISQSSAQSVIWSVGSDAHSLELVGDVSIAWGIVRKYQLYKKLIVPVTSCKKMSG